MIRKYKKISSSLFVLITLLLGMVRDVYTFNSYDYKTQKPQIHIVNDHTITQLRQRSNQLINLARQINNKKQHDLFLFTLVVLDELIELHNVEATKAKYQAREDLEQRNKLNRWSLKVLAFSNHLEEMRQNLSVLSDIRLHLEGFGELSFVIDGKPILVNSPLIKQQAEMEERIVLAVCANITCDQKQLQEIHERNEYRVRVNAQWNLQENGQTNYRTLSGLYFVFNSLDNKLQKERITRIIARDLNLIAESLILVHKQGYYIDWEYLYLDSEGGSEKNHQLILNQFKDAINLELLALPYLNDYPQKAIPWLQARIKKETAQHYIYDAETAVNELLHLL